MAGSSNSSPTKKLKTGTDTVAPTESAPPSSSKPQFYSGKAAAEPPAVVVYFDKATNIAMAEVKSGSGAPTQFVGYISMNIAKDNVAKKTEVENELRKGDIFYVARKVDNESGTGVPIMVPNGKFKNHQFLFCSQYIPEEDGDLAHYLFKKGITLKLLANDSQLTGTNGSLGAVFNRPSQFENKAVSDLLCHEDKVKMARWLFKNNIQDFLAKGESYTKSFFPDLDEDDLGEMFK